jgi:hypothetical protein
MTSFITKLNIIACSLIFILGVYVIIRYPDLLIIPWAIFMSIILKKKLEGEF